MKGFPTRTPADLEDRPRHQQWLVDGLWGRHAVGIVGGEPKCGKSFLALDLAVAVAAGVPCLRNFAAERPGPVLLFAAEDAGHIVRTRLQGIARAADADFGTLDIAVIDAPALRLDHRNDRQRLLECQSALKFDPLSACNIDPPEWHGGGCPGSQQGGPARLRVALCATRSEAAWGVPVGPPGQPGRGDGRRRTMNGS